MRSTSLATLRLPDWLTDGIWSACAAPFVRKKQPAAAPPEIESSQEFSEPPAPRPYASTGEPQNLIDEMLYFGRYALLLRPQLVGSLSAGQLARTLDALAEGMCQVPPGEVIVHRSLELEDQPNALANAGQLLDVDAYYLDRNPVTNHQFQQFVANAGYEQMAIWDPEIWPAVLDFVDQTGHPGPRFWRNGRFPRGTDQHPVVGVSWYEAAAYARWAGKRLPTDAEWVKAASWPVSLPGHPLLQRRFPWGEAIDRERANLWGSGPGSTVGVDQFQSGVSVGGAQQMIGNVWEWTADPFIVDDADHSNAAHPKMNSIRGGAFDTYLDCQSTCHFQSGDWSLARKHNIGFRTAISLCDIADGIDTAEAGTLEQTPSSLEEAHS